MGDNPNAAPPQIGLPVAQSDHPLDSITRFLDSTKFLAFVAALILSGMVWALWKG